MPLWSPSKIFTSLRQILKLSSVKSSTQTAMASWGLSGNWWLAVASTIGGVAKRFNEERKEMNELKDTEKKKGHLQSIHHGVNTVQQQQQLLQQQQQEPFWFIYPWFMILHGKNSSWKETLTLKPWEKDKNILQTVPAMVKYNYYV